MVAIFAALQGVTSSAARARYAVYGLGAYLDRRSIRGSKARPSLCESRAGLDRGAIAPRKPDSARPDVVAKAMASTGPYEATTENHRKSVGGSRVQYETRRSLAMESKDLRFGSRLLGCRQQRSFDPMIVVAGGPCMRCSATDALTVHYPKVEYANKRR